MLTSDEVRSARTRAAAMLARIGIVLTPHERDNLEVADFGLVKDLVYDADAEQWRVRFLVPKGVADGP